MYFCPKCLEGKRGQVTLWSPCATAKTMKPSRALGYGTLCGTTASSRQREVEHVNALCKLNAFDLFAYSCSLVCKGQESLHLR